MVCVERQIDDVFQRNDRTAGNLRNHLRGIVDDRALFGFVIEFAVNLRFGTELFDNFDTGFDNRIGRS